MQKAANEIRRKLLVTVMSGWFIYVHVPFCDERCGYCDFFSVSNAKQRQRYLPVWLDLVARELELLVQHRAIEPQPVRTLYFGGGTPSFLSAEAVDKFMRRLRMITQVCVDSEITMEMQPGTADAQKLQDLAAAGINRFSVGVQSFDDKNLRLMGRRHTAQQARDLVVEASQFANTSLDLISALPGQSFRQWEDELEQAIAHNVQHISVYELTFYSETRFGKSPELQAADEELRTRLFEHTTKFLVCSGFEQYEVSNFARPGHRCRHNENYWTLGDYIGLGAGAHSHLFPDRYRNDNDITAYGTAIEGGRLFRNKLPKTDSDVLRVENLYMALRLSDGVDLDQFAGRYGDIREVRKRELSSLLDEGLLAMNDGRLRLTSEGRLRFDSVLQYLL